VKRTEPKANNNKSYQYTGTDKYMLYIWAGHDVLSPVSLRFCSVLFCMQRRRKVWHIYLFTCHFLCWLRTVRVDIRFLDLFCFILLVYFRFALNWAGRARAVNGTFCRWWCRPMDMILTTLITR